LRGPPFFWRRKRRFMGGEKGEKRRCPMSATGRPSKLTPELEAELYALLEGSSSRAASCAMLGIHVSTLKGWLKLGRRGDAGRFTGLVEGVRRAEARFTVEAVRKIQRAGDDNWTALAWLLERRHPDEWGKDSRLIRDLQRQVRELERRLGQAPPPGRD